MTRLVCLDLETTGTDPKTCQVVQVAAIAVDSSSDWSGESRTMLCNPGMPIPAGAIAVHGITDADVKDAPLFSQVVGSLTSWIDSIAVTFNGAGYDLPIVARFGGWTPARHIDIMRIWHADQRAGEFEPVAPWHRAFAGDFSGKLRGAHLFWTGRHLSGAHDALIDCRGTLDVLRGILLDGRSLDDCLSITANPLPGDVDWSGKLKWSATGEPVFAFGKHKGERVADNLSYVTWMLKSDFPADTCKILRDIQRGKLPKRDNT